MKVAIYDFCETIVDVQTADLFLEEVLSKKRVFFIRKGLLYKVLAKIGVLPKSRKFYLLSKTKGVDKSFFDLVCQEYACYLNGRVNDKVLSQIYSDLSDGLKIIVVSGGFSIYIEEFFLSLGIPFEEIIANDICFENGICLGGIESLDCLSNEKVNRIEKYIESSKKSVEIDKCYSDHISDVPMLNLADKAYVVKKKKSFSWVGENKFQEIVVDD